MILKGLRFEVDKNSIKTQSSIHTLYYAHLPSGDKSEPDDKHKVAAG